MNLFKKIWLNFKPILKLTFIICSSALSVITILLSFLSWDDMKITKPGDRIGILLGIIALSFVTSIFLIVIILRKNELWANGKNKVLAYYGDLFKTMKNSKKKIIVIPVNDTFETIVDDDLSQNKPLVSSNTIHGRWIKYMASIGVTHDQLNSKIDQFFKSRNINPEKTYDETEKSRGNLNSYKMGEVAIINGDNNTTFYLIAISKFNENNNAFSNKRIIRNCMDDLIDFYDENGQGYPIYIPLFGTGRSKSNLNHQQVFNLIKGSILTNEKNINGIMNIVVNNEDKDKISIFK